MPIAINGSGTITGISVGGIPDGVVDTDVLAANVVTFGKIGTTEQGQLCKAWVNFNGTSTVAIRASFNVSSITDNGTGDYTVNFTTALVDANYSVVALATVTGFTTSTNLNNTSIAYPTPISYATSSIRLRHLNPGDSANAGGGPNDTDYTNVAIFR